MTREEAIKELKEYEDGLDLEYATPFDKAILYAIKALEQEPTTKNDLGVDCISRAEAIKCLECDFDITGKENMKTVVNYINSAHDKIVNLPRVKQEPFEPMVEIDLYSVIKQKYIEREVLDKIRAEIKALTSNRGFLSCSVDYIHEKIDAVFDKYKAESEYKDDKT